MVVAETVDDGVTVTYDAEVMVILVAVKIMVGGGAGGP